MMVRWESKSKDQWLNRDKDSVMIHIGFPGVRLHGTYLKMASLAEGLEVWILVDVLSYGTSSQGPRQRRLLNPADPFAFWGPIGV